MKYRFLSFRLLAPAVLGTFYLLSLGGESGSLDDLIGNVLNQMLIVIPFTALTGVILAIVAYRKEKKRPVSALLVVLHLASVGAIFWARLVASNGNG